MEEQDIFLLEAQDNLFLVDQDILLLEEQDILFLDQPDILILEEQYRSVFGTAKSAPPLANPQSIRLRVEGSECTDKPWVQHLQKKLVGQVLEMQGNEWSVRFEVPASHDSLEKVQARVGRCSQGQNLLHGF